MSQETRLCYAFYRESSTGFAGEPTYNGISNGLERSFFGEGPSALEKCKKMVAGARKNSKIYQVLKYEYLPYATGAKTSVLYSHGVYNPKAAKRSKPKQNA